MSTPIYCDHCTPSPVCDFCRHYDFNGDPQGAYIDQGWCRLHKRQEDPGSGCDDFHCKSAPAQEES